MEICQSGLQSIAGVRQGCNLSPDLFNMISEDIMKMALENVKGGVAVDGLNVNNLRFSHDIDLVSESPQQLQELTTEVNKSSKRFGLRINEQKTKTMVIGKKHEDINILLGNSTLEEVEEFVYLGSLLTEDVNCVKDIRRRSSLTSAMFGKLNRIWKSSNISLWTKIKAYEALVIPVFTYGFECWTLKKCDERKMSAI